MRLYVTPLAAASHFLLFCKRKARGPGSLTPAWGKESIGRRELLKAAKTVKMDGTVRLLPSDCWSGGCRVGWQQRRRCRVTLNWQGRWRAQVEYNRHLLAMRFLVTRRRSLCTTYPVQSNL